jgi:spoIIIJ-associated protein
MDIPEIIKKNLEDILIKLTVDYSDIEITEGEENTYMVNVKSEDQSLLIGHHGTSIHALQHLLKIMSLKDVGTNQQFHVIVDIDDYRKRQEENIILMAERKVDAARKYKRPQTLPPMAPYFRRKIHLHLMGAGFEDVETLSEGDGDNRYIIIKLKS